MKVKVCPTCGSVNIELPIAPEAGGRVCRDCGYGGSWVTFPEIDISEKQLSKLKSSGKKTGK